jgi:multisubunit Na+/H+ antiporter MnhB subunit
MRRALLIAALTVLGAMLLVFAPTAFAAAGEGFYGESSDKSVTNVMFITIAFFPVVITVFSLIQWRLEKRQRARMDAEQRRAANADWRGGW